MLFNSYIFWLFFGVVLLLYRRLPHRGQNVMLLVASYIFYGAWDWRFLSLILISTLVDYVAAIQIGKRKDARARKVLLGISCCANLGILGFFKYFNFFAQELTHLLSAIGLEFMAPTLDIVLPVGISFYTFQTMSYTIDVYRGRTQPLRDPLDFALYVAFFPQLVAGPIERSTDLVPQIVNPRTVRASDFSEGLWLILWGLFKKVVIADNMAIIVNGLFAENPRALSGPECWIAVYAFALQIYGDFSGYSAIARGVARWMGFHLSPNFLFPYFSATPSEFWTRWHISLSSWLRDYLYIPLGGNRGGMLITCRNLLLTMVLGGLWHGAAWGFVVWGLVHGLLLVGYRLTARRSIVAQVSNLLYRRFPIGRLFDRGVADSARSGLETRDTADWKSALHRRQASGCEISGPGMQAGATLGVWRLPLALLFFHLVCVAWLFFRAEDVGQALVMLGRMFTDFQGSTLALFGISSILFFGLPILLLEFWLFVRNDDLLPARKHWAMRGMVYAYLAFMLMTFAPAENYEFIYFQF
ncbi:MAG: MBOAT family O-acyltransferase [Verrucomicrobiota bacterium]